MTSAERLGFPDDEIKSSGASLAGLKGTGSYAFLAGVGPNPGAQEPFLTLTHAGQRQGASSP